jgi:regulator of cell morphogenesis and NO signaling
MEATMALGRAYDYNNWELDFLTDHILNVHHNYVEQNIPLILTYCEKVAKVHGKTHPEVIKIRDLFYQIAGELASHLKKEELILFPFIKKAVKAEKEGSSLQRPPFGTAENPVRMMEAEHESAGELFKEIARLSDGYTAPEGACNTFRAMYAKLDEFEQDLHLHVHLENNILFPKALELERKVVK